MITFGTGGNLKFVENNLELELEYFVKCQNQIVRYMPGGQVAWYHKKLLNIYNIYTRWTSGWVSEEVVEHII